MTNMLGLGERIRTSSLSLPKGTPYQIGPHLDSSFADKQLGSCGRTRTYTSFDNALTVRRIYQFHHTGMFAGLTSLVGIAGFEPATSRPPDERAT